MYVPIVGVAEVVVSAAVECRKLLEVRLRTEPVIKLLLPLPLLLLLVLLPVPPLLPVVIISDDAVENDDDAADDENDGVEDDDELWEDKEATPAPAPPPLPPPSLLSPLHLGPAPVLSARFDVTATASELAAAIDAIVMLFLLLI